MDDGADLGRFDGAYLDLVGVDADGRIAFIRDKSVDGRIVHDRMVWLDVTSDSYRGNGNVRPTAARPGS